MLFFRVSGIDALMQSRYDITATGGFIVSKRILALGIITFALLAFRIAFEPSAFKDYFPYLGYFQDIKTFGIWAGGLDLASNSVFYAVGLFTDDRELGVAVLYGYMLALFITGSWYLVTIEKVGWLNYWLFFCLFGPLLALITIRATPAYFSFFFAFFALRRRKPGWAVVFSSLAAAFHFSGILLLPVVVTAAAFGATLDRSPKARLAFWVLFVLICLLGSTLVFTGANSVFSALEFADLLLRYSTYLTDVSSESGVFHKVYFIAALALAAGFLLYSRNVAWSAKLLIGLSAIQFFLIAWSPVLAFRQSIFWVAPAILAFPFLDVLKSRSVRILLALLFSLVLAYSFFGIFEEDYLQNI